MSDTDTAFVQYINQFLNSLSPGVSFSHLNTKYHVESDRGNSHTGILSTAPYHLGLQNGLVSIALLKVSDAEARFAYSHLGSQLLNKEELLRHGVDDSAHFVYQGHLQPGMTHQPFFEFVSYCGENATCLRASGLPGKAEKSWQRRLDSTYTPKKLADVMRRMDGFMRETNQ